MVRRGCDNNNTGSHYHHYYHHHHHQSTKTTRQSHILPKFYYSFSRVWTTLTIILVLHCTTTTTLNRSATILSSSLLVSGFQSQLTPRTTVRQKWRKNQLTLQRVFFVTTSMFLSASSKDNPAAAAAVPTSIPTTNPLHLYGLSTDRPILLGSASFTRKLILKEMGIPYHVLVRPIDEKEIGCRAGTMTPSELVLTLAQAKMDHLINELNAGRCDHDLPQTCGNTSEKADMSWIVLTGDQVVVCNDQILEKPESVDEARQFVAQYATHFPSTVGSCVLTHLPTNIRVSGVDTATVRFKPSLGESQNAKELVDTLLAQKEPILSCAGGLMVEHPLVREYIDGIDGTEDSVMGLSKDLVLRLLQELAEQLKQKDVVEP